MIRRFISLGIHRYLLASGINTLIGILVIACIYRVTGLPFLTVGLAAVLGYGYSILSYHYLAFNGKGKRPPYARYAAVYGLAYLLNTSFTVIGLKLTGNFFLVQLFTIPLVVVLQWISARLWVFCANS